MSNQPQSLICYGEKVQYGLVQKMKEKCVKTQQMNLTKTTQYL